MRGDSMDNLFPEDFEDEELELDEIDDESEEEAVGYKKSIYFDEASGDFKRDGTKKLVEANGVDAWIQWCMKVLRTKRYVCQAYSDDIGIDIESAFQAESREEAESILENEITEALEADPYGRTDMVQSVTFQWMNADLLEVTCDVLGIDSNEVELKATIER